MSEQRAVIHAALTLQQAYLLKNLLQEHGIEAWVVNEALGSAAGGVPLGWATAPRVEVDARDEAGAREIVLSFRRQQPRTPLDRDLEKGPQGNVWLEWPRCEGCGRSRLTICPACQVAGTDFPLADYLPAEPTAASQQDTSGSVAGAVPAPSEPLLMCPTCEEAFVPKLYRRCAWCGHDAGTGRELDGDRRGERLNKREKVVLAVLVLVGGLMTLYFWLLLRG